MEARLHPSGTLAICENNMLGQNKLVPQIRSTLQNGGKCMSNQEGNRMNMRME